MAIANGSGGYQVGDGNTSDTLMGVCAPVALTGDTTVTAAQLTAGIISCNKGSDAGLTVTTCTGAALDAGLPNAKVGSCFDVAINNANNAGSSSTVTFSAGTGITLYGTGTVARAGANLYRFVRTGTAAWSAYLV